jgi:hypothetical protein
MLVLFLFALCASAQALTNPSDRPNVTVMQKKWRMEIRNPALGEESVKEANEREQERRNRRETERKNEILIERGLPPVAPPVPVRAPETGARGPVVTYVYEVKVSNTGEKGIRTLTWDYVFLEPGTEREVGRRRFVSKVRISPGSTRNVVMRSTSPPTGTINAMMTGKKLQDQYAEQVVMKSVRYADGSVWQAASN